MCFPTRFHVYSVQIIIPKVYVVGKLHKEFTHIFLSVVRMNHVYV